MLAPGRQTAIVMAQLTPNRETTAALVPPLITSHICYQGKVPDVTLDPSAEQHIDQMAPLSTSVKFTSSKSTAHTLKVTPQCILGTASANDRLLTSQLLYQRYEPCKGNVIHNP